MPKDVMPIASDYGRIPEQGRIRLGVKTERAMKALETFRFTSPDWNAIAALAALYGGKAKPWSDKKASPKEQWEVITEADSIKVFLPQNSIDVWYEEWSGGGLLRRCDGIEAQVEIKTPDGTDIDIVPCYCSQLVDKGQQMKCRPYTRLSVILPEIRFGGTWRLESKGWNASKELPAMAAVIAQMQAIGIVEGVLSLEKRTKVSGGQTKHFVVPKLSTDTSPLEIMAGGARPQYQIEPPATTEIPMLDVVDAEIVEESVPPLNTGLIHDKGAAVPIPKRVQEEGAEIAIAPGQDTSVPMKKNPNPPPRFIPV